MEQQFEHLSDAQIESYGLAMTGGAPGQPGRETDPEVETHLAACGDCRTRVLERQRSRLGIMSSGYTSPERLPRKPDRHADPVAPDDVSPERGPRNSDGSDPATPDDVLAPSACPSEASLRDLAAGLIDATAAAQLTRHAAQCDRCGPVLRAYTEDFADDLSTEDQALRNQLNSASPSWQKKMARQMANAVSSEAASLGREFREGSKSATAAPSAHSSISNSAASRVAATPGAATPDATTAGAGTRQRPAARERFSFRLPSLKWFFVPATALAAAVVAFLIWNSQRETPEKVEKLLAQAYTEQRTMEMRWPGAEYAPIRQRRGADESRLNLPGPLLKAESMLHDRAISGEKAASWLQVRARADLMEWRYESAIASLEQAGVLKARDPQLKIDLATAYFQRAQELDNPSDYGRAIELLGEVLQIQPDNTVALFNRAVAEEKVYMYGEAIRDWEGYLQKDATSDWAGEARDRLRALKEKHAERSNFLSKPLHTPPEIAQLLRADKDAANVELNTRAEDYLDLATREWLDWNCTGSAIDQSASRLAITSLARILASRAGDRWLMDMSAAPKSTVFCAGAAALRDAIQANAAGDFVGAEVKAKDAIEMFRKAGSRPGILRANVEQVYAFHRSAKARQCLWSARSIQPELQKRRYRWAEIQVYLEESSCYDLLSRFDSSEKAMRMASDLARLAGYDTLYLRALGFIAEVEMVKGNTSKSWTLHVAALKQYWESGAAPMRAFQLYGGLFLMAEDQRQWHLECGLLNEALSAIQLTGNRINEALTRYHLGEALAAMGRLESASREYEKATHLLASLPRNAVTDYYGVLAQIGAAKMEAGRDPFVAQKRLQEARPFLRATDWITLLDFYRTLGRVKLAEGDPRSAEDSFYKAAKFAEVALLHLKYEHDRIIWTRAADDVYRSLTEIEFQKGNPRRALAIWEWYRGAALRGDAERTKILRRDAGLGLDAIENVAFSVPSDEIVLIYAVFTSRLAIWVLDKDSVTGTSIEIPSDRLNKTAHEFLALCSSPTSQLALVKQKGQELFHMLLSPVEKQIADSRKRIVFELDNSIGSIPVAALVRPDGEFLGEKYAVSLSPGLMYRKRLRIPRPVSRSTHALVVGATVTDDIFRAEGVRPLPAARVEAETVARYFPSKQVLIGRDATWTAIEKALPQAELFHFAGHTATGADSTKLLLAKDRSGGDSDAPSSLTSHALAKSLFRRCNLAVFSACSIERSETGWINGDGLVLAVLNAGVPDVVATQWNIDSQSAASFMQFFYESLWAPSSTSRALQNAANRLRQDPRTQHPFYWAGFIDFSRS